MFPVKDDMRSTVFNIEIRHAIVVCLPEGIPIFLLTFSYNID